MASPTDHLVPVRRFEWERIVRRARLSHKYVRHHLPPPVKGKTRPRPVAAMTVKGVAFALASYGNGDGTKIHPGVDTLALDLETSIKSVGQALIVLRSVGLIERVKAGNRADGEADLYRLTMPEDILEHLQMLSPPKGRSK